MSDSKTTSPCCDATARISLNVEQAVRDRYAEGARAVEPQLCCPVDYDADYLKLIPQEIIEKDYGCGDPSKYVHPGDVVVDLGSGGGKACYMIAQKVGASGKAIGVDFNDTMLELARKYQGEMADKLGYANVEFRKGKIQDLSLDLAKVDQWLASTPVDSSQALDAMAAECDRLRAEEPLIADATADVVVSNCVLNLVRPEEKRKLFKEIHRVLRRGGRAVISDIVCDEPPTEAMKNDADLWSGCISGAFLEHEFLEMFHDAGLYGIEILERQAEPWQTIDGIEFRSMTVRAYKGKEGPCMDHHQAVVYTGPFRQVVDDDGHTLVRGRRMAVCAKTYSLYTDANGPYAGMFAPVEPIHAVAPDDAEPFACTGAAIRHPRQTKGEAHGLTSIAGGACCADDNCC